jgi:hypothetical protein
MWFLQAVGLNSQCIEALLMLEDSWQLNFILCHLLRSIAVAGTPQEVLILSQAVVYHAGQWHYFYVKFLTWATGFIAIVEIFNSSYQDLVRVVVVDPRLSDFHSFLI